MEINKYRFVETEYLTPDKTVETVILSNSKKEKLFFIYIYKGQSYRVFDNLLDFISFFEDKNTEIQHFENENELDNFLLNYNIEK